ncbi:MAG: family efflux transporter, subunit [Caulobacteraceae bacterium]|nr:family efflux transporter, subunit [Caulobacteraceae bacterium]
MSRKAWITLLVVLLVAGGLAAFMLLRHPAEEAEADAEPVALVTVATVRNTSVGEDLIAYGTVEADPAGAAAVAAPRAVVVARILTRVGATVAAGAPLIEIVDAPASTLAYRQAQDALTFATNDLARVQRLYDDHLVASDQLNAAKKALADAQSTLTSQQAMGAGQATQTLTAPRAGVVTEILVKTGDRLAQDAPMLGLAGAGGLVAKLGVDPAGHRLSTGQGVELTAAGAAPVRGTVQMIGQVARPDTHLIDLIVSLPVALPVGTPVQGRITLGAHSAWVVPRAAIVSDETGPHVFTIRDGKATRVFVRPGLEAGDDIAVTGIGADAPVAVEGAYELEDGMAVKIKSPEAKDAEAAGDKAP